MDNGAPAFERVDRNGTATLVITGEVDLACADELREQLHAITATASATGAVDLSGVTFLDSSGLGVLIAAKKRAAASDADLALVDPSPACRSVLSISGADQFFEIRE
jgi:anti-sigma B factor antagonist